MLERKSVVQTPGKMMLAGEFAVLEAYQKTLVTAVNRFVYATLEQAPENKISLPDFGLHELLWQWEREQIHFSSSDERLDFVAHAMETVFAYLTERQIPLQPIHLTVTSELSDKSGIKYGLGSSAAVVSAVVEVMLRHFLPEKPERELIFKLAAIAHVKTQGSGSGADIAASVYGGLLSYSSFQAEWLLDKIRQTTSVAELVERDWQYLSIERLPFPDFVQFLVAWTGKAASTKKLVAQMQQMKTTNKEMYRSFIQDSAQAVTHITAGIKERDSNILFAGITENRHILREIGAYANVSIETPLLAALNKCAEEAGGAGKSSGAGGGDCGIAFIPLKQSAEALQACWRHNGITPLELHMYKRY